MIKFLLKTIQNTLKLSFVVCISLFLIQRFISFANAEDLLRWKQIRPDLEIAFINVPTRFFNTMKIDFIRFGLDRYQLGVVKASDIGGNRNDIKNIVTLSKAVAGINANFFDESGNALGLVLSRGIIRQKIHSGGNLINGILTVSPNGVEITGRKTSDFHSVTEALQAGPRLINKGTLLKLNDNQNSSRRAGVCIDKQDKIILFVSEQSFFGITLNNLQELLISKQLNCMEALNFDGGGSAQGFVSSTNPDIENLYIPGTDPVPVALVVYTK